jgi:hypothetical protein
MADRGEDALSTLLRSVADAFSPLTQPFDADQTELWLERLGWDPGRLSVDLSALSAVGAEVAALADKIDALESATSDADRLAAGLDLMLALARVANGIRRLVDQDWSGAPADFRAFVLALPERVFDILFTEKLQGSFPRTYATLVLLGIIEIIVEDDDSGSRMPVTRDHLAWDNVAALFTDPRRHWERIYGFGIEGGFRSTPFLLNLAGWLTALGQTVRVTEAGPFGRFAFGEGYDGVLPPLLTWPVLAGGGSGGGFELGLRMTGLPRSQDEDATGLLLLPYATGRAGGTVAPTPEVTFAITTALDPGAPLVLRIFPDQSRLEPVDPASAATGSAALTVTFTPSEPRAVLDIPGGSGLFVESLSARGELVLTAGRFEVEGAVDFRGSLVIQGRNGDGFIQKILPEDPIRLPVEIGAGYSAARGFFMRGGAGLEFSVPVNENFGPIYLSSIDLGFFIRGGELEVLTAVSGGAEIGPVVASVGKVGLTTKLALGKPGALGESDLTLGFKPPDLIALAVNAGPVSGGGMVQIDPPNYAGMLALSVDDTVDITAFCLITTRLPDGRDGFSLLMSILAEFAPIQLGMGFALTGVGGLIGIHRDMKEAALQQTVRDHSLDALLFPESPIRDASRIINAIQAIFPPTENTHVVGPMVKLLWGGSVELVRFAVGVFVRLGDPVRVAIMGQAAADLPDKRAPLIQLNLDLLGFIDFGNQTIAIDGYLYSSRVLMLPLQGGMALRAGWGEHSGFTLSLGGGFHPRFTPPPGFPALERLGVSMTRGPVHLSLTSYITITTNTLQFGAAAELVVGGSGWGLQGGFVFDAIFVFRPFSFEIALAAWVDVIAGVRVSSPSASRGRSRAPTIPGVRYRTLLAPVLHGQGVVRRALRRDTRGDHRRRVAARGARA